MSQTTTGTRVRSGSVTPRRRGDELAPRDEFAALVAMTPILLQLPDLHPNEGASPQSEYFASSPIVDTSAPVLPETDRPETDLAGATSGLSGPSIRVGGSSAGMSEGTWTVTENLEQAVKRDSSLAAPVNAPVSESWSDETKYPENTGVENTGAENTGAENTGDENTGVENTGAENTGAENTGAENTGAENTGAENTGAENARAENIGVASSGSESESETADSLPWETTETVVGHWTEMGGRIFVGLLSILLVVTLTWSIISDGEQENDIPDPLSNTEAADVSEPGPAAEINTSLSMQPVDGAASRAEGVSYVTTASGEMPAAPIEDGSLDSFTIRTLRPSADRTNLPTEPPSYRVGQPMEYSNDSINR
jgi:hypothetical protein